MKKEDRELGLHRPISRRDFLNDASVAGLGALFGTSVHANAEAQRADYPPVQTGMRGSHPGSYEAAHALRDGGVYTATSTEDEAYDLVVVGAGISGLTAAYYYRQKFGPQARILILENHDDFGGHARRNEFHQSGSMRLSLGGTHNLEHWQFSKTTRTLMKELGIDVKKLLADSEFQYGEFSKNGPAIWFDKQTYGEDKLVTPYTLEWWHPGVSVDCIDRFPISDAAKSQLKRLYNTKTNLFKGWSEEAVESYLAAISYPEFLRRHAGLGDEAIQLFSNSQHGAWGVELRALSASEGLYSGLPGLNLLGLVDEMKGWTYPVAMFPDGNASVARLLVHKLIPDIAPGTHADNVALARFDYSYLDKPGTSTRLRLNATVVNAVNTPNGVAVTYVEAGQGVRVQARHCVMACYHSVLPYVCPDLPAEQKEAQSYQVKIPMLLTNVLLRSSKAMDKLGIDSVVCPGRMHGVLFMFKGINTGGYAHPMADDGPVPLVFWGSVSPPPEVTDLKAQLRASRQKMLELTLEDYEREVRTVLDGLLGPAGFDVQKDILAITVNRWPHGYSYEYMDLWDEDFPEGRAPHNIASTPHGHITFANSDAGASAYTHVAIDEAYRAVAELS
ncbi:MAG: NAD(P)-binding protein [Pseudomonadota bacterium]|nr:NAD(P)-binding protein [Pseudomonadota bacterium]